MLNWLRGMIQYSKKVGAMLVSLRLKAFSSDASWRWIPSEGTVVLALVEEESMNTQYVHRLARCRLELAPFKRADRFEVVHFPPKLSNRKAGTGSMRKGRKRSTGGGTTEPCFACGDGPCPPVHRPGLVVSQRRSVLREGPPSWYWLLWRSRISPWRILRGCLR